MRRSGWVKCAVCPSHILPSAADVDHIRPLALGGEDTAENVQILCRPCHKAKTRRDFNFSNPPF
ncbi:HNH endonuclease signature motif containing protein [Kitasatospora sp. MAP12-44]|nr:HNH endonuclease signature motif containing protein [Kitasatospora sp. MAP12-44]